MANLYIIDRPVGRNGLALAAIDPDARVVLIQDGVYLGLVGSEAIGPSVYAIERDVTRRGLARRMADGVELIDYAAFVDLVVANKVVNFA